MTPFDDDVSNAFAAKSKQNLRKLLVTCGSECYSEDAGDDAGEYHRDEGFQYEPDAMVNNFKACPFLEVFHLLLPPIDNDVLPIQDGVNNDFLRAIAANCPKFNKMIISKMQPDGTGEYLTRRPGRDFEATLSDALCQQEHAPQHDGTPGSDPECLREAARFSHSWWFKGERVRIRVRRRGLPDVKVLFRAAS